MYIHSNYLICVLSPIVQAGHLIKHLIVAVDLFVAILLTQHVFGEVGFGTSV